MAATGSDRVAAPAAARLLGVTDENRRWWVLGAMGLTLFMVLFDETVVGVALDTIQDDLDMSPLQGHWVVNSYMLTLAAFVAVGGRLGDLFGYRRMFVVGALVFGSASLCCAVAASGPMLLAARAVQGVGAAVMFPLSLALIMIVFPVEQRGMAIGVYGMLGTVGLALGPLLGGIFSEYLSWRWIFSINVVATLGLLVVFVASWREPPPPPRQPLDWRGLVTLVIALTALVLAIMQASEWGWDSPLTVTLTVGGAVSAALFWRIERRCDDPLIDVTLLRDGRFSAFSAGVLAAQFSKSAVIVFLALYLQQELGYTAVEAGLALMPGMLANVVTALPGGRLIDRVGSDRPALLGLAGVAVAQVAIVALVGVDSYAPFVPVLVLWGVALVFTFQGALTGVANSVGIEQQGQASGIANEGQMLGGAFGVAIMSALQVGGASWAVVFAAPALVVVVVLVVGAFAVRRARPSPIGRVGERASH